MPLNVISTVELIDDDLLEGLVLDLDHPLTPVFVEICINGILFHAELAVGLVHPLSFKPIAGDRFRLIAEKIGDVNPIIGRFCYRVPPYVPRDREIDIVVYADSRKNTLWRVRTRLDLKAERILKEHFAANPAVRTEVSGLANGEIRFNGYCVGEQNRDSVISQVDEGVLLSFRFDSGGSGPLLTFPNANPDLKFIAPPNLPSWSYAGSFRPDPQRERDSHFSLRQAEKTKVLGGRAGRLIIPPNYELEISAWSFPGDALLKRTIGFANRVQYYFSGYATYRMLEDCIAEASTQPLGSFKRILDWGSGSGRLSQHLVRRIPADVIGIDIDRENVAWCQNNLTAGTFSVVPFQPPTEFPNGGFDLVVGISVFTHLDRASERAWLMELRRLLDTDGIAAVTIQSVHSLHIGDHLPRRYWDLMRKGIDDGHIGDALLDVVGKTDFAYYRETFHSHEYVLQTWGRWFDILRIYVGASFNFQDLVVMRKRAHVPAI